MPQSELWVIKYVARVNSNFLGVGADWNENTNLLQVTESIGKETCRVVASFVLPAFCVLLSFSRLLAIFVLKTQDFDLPLQVLYIAMSVGYFAMAVAIAGFAVSRRSLITLFNQLLKLYQPLAASLDYGNNSLIAHYIFLSIVALPVTVLMVALEFYYAWVFTNSILFAGLAIIVALQYSMSFAQIFLLQTSYVLMYFRIVHSALTWKRIESMAEFNGVMLQYRGLSILCNYFNTTFCRLIVPGVKYLLSLTGMTAVLVGVRVKLDQSTGATLFLRCLLLAGVYVLLIVIAGASMMTNLWKMSTTFMAYFKRVQPSFQFRQNAQFGSPAVTAAIYVRACSKSLMTLRFAVGSFYYMEREARLTLASNLLEGTGNMLIGFK